MTRNGDRRHPAALILCYHRVLPALSPAMPALLDPWRLVVPADAFQRQLETLCRRFAIVPLQELVRQISDGAVRANQAALTFDDGYADTYHHAYPTLRRMGLPATVFLVTDHIDRQRPFWWHRLAAILAARRGSMGGDHRRTFLRLWRWLRAVSDPAAREAWLDVFEAAGPAVDVDAWAGVGRPLAWDEIRRMQRDGMVFEPHSASHPSLVALPQAAVREEVRRCRHVMQRRLGAWPPIFAYPFGHVNDTVRATVRAEGFAAAVTVREGSCVAGSDPYLLPRLVVRNWPLRHFTRALDVLAHTGMALGEPEGVFETAAKSLLPAPLLRLSARLRYRRLTGEAREQSRLTGLSGSGTSALRGE